MLKCNYAHTICAYNILYEKKDGVTMNKLKQRIISLLLVFIMVFSIMVTGCDKKENDSSDDKSQTTETPEEKNDNDDTDLLSHYNYEGLSFDEFTEELFKESITSDAVNVNYLLVDPEGYGIKEYPNDLGEYSKEYFTREIAHSKLILETLEKYDYNELNKEQQLTYDMIKASCGNDHMVEGMEYYFSCLGPSLGIQANLPLILCEYHWYNKSYIDKYLTILDTVDDYFQQICTFEKEKSEAGLFMSDDMADATIKQCETFIANTDNNLLITNFNEKIDKYEGLTDKEKLTNRIMQQRQM